MKKVLVFGTFDGIHKGHLDLFSQAKKYGDYLSVVVARDKNVLKIKNRLPQRDEKIRLKEVEAIDSVDEARLGYLDNPHKIIKETKPDVICLGYDQSSYVEGLDKLGIKIVRLKPYKPEQFKSSIINKK